MRIHFADMELDAPRFLLWRGGQRVALRPKVFDLLIHLVRHRDRVVSREELIRLLWGDTIVGAGSLSGLVNELRMALGECGGGNSSIRTVHARGYQFVAEVRLGGEEASRQVIGGTLSSPSPSPSLSSPSPSPSPSRLPADLVERVRSRLLQFARAELDPVFVSEGFGPLSDLLIDALSREMVRVRHSEHSFESVEPVATRPEPSSGLPERRMRMARSDERDRRIETG